MVNYWSVSHRSISKSTPRTENSRKFCLFGPSTFFEDFFLNFFFLILVENWNTQLWNSDSAINILRPPYRSPANREKLIFHRFFGPFWSIYGHFLGIYALWANFFPSFAESNCQALTKWILGGHSVFTFWNMGPRVLSRFSFFVNVLNTQNFVRIFPFTEYLHIIYRWKDTVIGYQNC